MTLKWHKITSEEAYRAARYQLMVKLEKSEPLPYLDTAHGGVIPTIGIGVNLRVHMHEVAVELLGAWARKDENKKLFAKLEKELTAVVTSTTYATGQNGLLQANLNAVMHSWSVKHPGVPPTFSLMNSQINRLFDVLAPHYEKIVDKWMSGIPLSHERLTFFSLAFNNPVLLGTGLTSAIASGDRAKAWWEIRYHSNPHQEANDANGVANRRYLEALYLNLYPPGTIGKKDALDVGEMYANHRDASRQSGGILDYEDRFSPSEAATNKKAPINHIYDELQPAIGRLKEDFAILYPTNYEELLVASDSKLNLHGDGTAFDSSENDDDLLVGSEKANTLIGGVGDDALIGQSGDDKLQGGDGNDWIDGGKGKDVMNGGLGNDVYVVDNAGDKILEDSAPNLDNASDFIDLRAPVSLRFHYVEGLSAKSVSGADFKITTGTDLGFVGLSSGSDRFALEIDQRDSTPGKFPGLVIDAGGGADTITISSQVDLYGPFSDVSYAVSLINFSSDDRVDLSSFGISRLVAGEETASAPPGVVFMAPFSRLDLEWSGVSMPVVVGSQWSILNISSSGIQRSLDFGGENLTASSFIT